MSGEPVVIGRVGKPCVYASNREWGYVVVAVPHAVFPARIAFEG